MSRKGLNLLHVNTRSIYRKIPLLSSLYRDVDFLCCTETWLDSRMPDNLIKIENMHVLRCDRKSTITNYNIHIIWGGVCIYVGRKWYEFTSLVKESCVSTEDYEIVSITINKPTFKKLFIACVYKPPKGKIENCLKFLNTQIEKLKRQNFEIWILGDFNTDMLKRDDINTVRINRFIKKLGLKQYIVSITRPNKKGGSCIDLIMTDCNFVSNSGNLFFF